MFTIFIRRLDIFMNKNLVIIINLSYDQTHKTKGYEWYNLKKQLLVCFAKLLSYCLTSLNKWSESLKEVNLKAFPFNK
jgi:hypothetical protein